MKKITPIFTANIVKGKMKFSGAVSTAMKMWIGSFLTGTKVDITIKKHTSKRTNKQNSYYWSVVVPLLCDYFGYDLDEMHEELKLKFNPSESKLDCDKIIGGSTTKLLKDEYFGDETSYVSRIRRWAATDYNINIPDPERVE